MFVFDQNLLGETCLRRPCLRDRLHLGHLVRLVRPFLLPCQACPCPSWDSSTVPSSWARTISFAYAERRLDPRISCARTTQLWTSPRSINDSWTPSRELLRLSAPAWSLGPSSLLQDTPFWIDQMHNRSTKSPARQPCPCRGLPVLSRPAAPSLFPNWTVPFTPMGPTLDSTVTSQSSPGLCIACRKSPEN